MKAPPLNIKIMFIVVALMLSGIFLGYFLRNKGAEKVTHIITPLIWLLLFLLGLTVGKDPKIMGGLTTIGKDALIITSFAVAGSALAAWGLLQILKRIKSKNE